MRRPRSLRNQPIPEEDSEDISADEAERDRKGPDKNLARMQTEGSLSRTTTLMKKKTIVTRQVTTVDDLTGEIIDQKTEQEIVTDSEEEEEEDEAVADEKHAAIPNDSGEPDGIMTMHDSRTDKTYKIEIRNNKMKASDLFEIKGKEGKGLTVAKN